jgi:26S proteasome regulatory subunit N12
MDALLKQLESHVASGRIDDGLSVLKQIQLERLAHQRVNDVEYCTALELGVFLSIKAEDLDMFSRYMAQLQPIYANNIQSPRKYHILGLNLMALLVTNSSSEFHSELELLPLDAQVSSKYLQFPIAIERKLMVGIYDEIMSMELPDPSYQFFMDQLNTTIRDAIADCIEVSYETLTVQQAAQLMNEPDIRTYMESFREDWIVEDQKIVFQPAAAASGSYTAADLRSQQWIQQSLTYATEMERIV